MTGLRDLEVGLIFPIRSARVWELNKHLITGPIRALDSSSLRTFELIVPDDPAWIGQYDCGSIWGDGCVHHLNGQKIIGSASRLCALEGAQHC